MKNDIENVYKAKYQDFGLCSSISLTLFIVFLLVQQATPYFIFFNNILSSFFIVVMTLALAMTMRCFFEVQLAPHLEARTLKERAIAAGASFGFWVLLVASYFYIWNNSVILF